MDPLVSFVLLVSWGFTLLGLLLMLFVDPAAINMFLGSLLAAIPMTIIVLMTGRS